MREPPLARASGHPGEQARDAASCRDATGLAVLLEPLDHRLVEYVVVTWPETVPSLIHAPAGLGEQLAGDRRLPGGMRLPGRNVERPGRRFRRRRRHAGAPTVAVIRVVVLLGPVKTELVARGRLPCQPDRPLTLQAVVERLLRSVEVHDPGIRVAGVLVHEHARHRALPPDLAVRPVEPELVPLDPAAVHAADVVHFDELERRPQARIFERLRVVAALQRATRTAVVDR